MKPGRKLDTLIAEKVFGLKVVKTVWGKQKQYCAHSIGEPDYYDSYGEMILSNPLPNYSTDIAAAWEVVEKLRENHCCLEFDLDNEGPQWEVSIRGPKFVDLDTPFCLEKACLVAETLPEAVCLAALKAVGYEAPNS